MMPASVTYEEKASRLAQSRLWTEMDTFIDTHAPRWARRAEAVLNDEGNRAAKGYEAGGAGAAVAAVDDAEWLEYIRRLWFTVVPDAGEVVTPFLPTGKLSTELVQKALSPLLDAAVNWIRANGAREAGLISNASRKGIQNQIRIGVSKGETTEQIAERIRKHYRSIRQSRAETIARTEVHAASNYGSLAVASDADQRLDKIWVDTPDGRTRDAHVSAGGQKKPLGSPFIVDGEQLMHPGDTSLGGSSENVINCRCTLFYTRKERAVSNKPRRRSAA